MVDADVEKAIFEQYGIKEKEEEKTNQPQKCNVCDMYNSSEATICSKCGKPLDLETALAEEETSQKEKEEQRQKMEEMELNLLQLREEIMVLRKNQKSDDKVIRMANTILYKNQDKIPNLSLKSPDSKYTVDDKEIEMTLI